MQSCLHLGLLIRGVVQDIARRGKDYIMIRAKGIAASTYGFRQGQSERMYHNRRAYVCIMYMIQKGHIGTVTFTLGQMLYRNRVATCSALFPSNM